MYMYCMITFTSIHDIFLLISIVVAVYNYRIACLLDSSDKKYYMFSYDMETERPSLYINFMLFNPLNN